MNKLNICVLYHDTLVFPVIQYIGVDSVYII